MKNKTKASGKSIKKGKTDKPERPPVKAKGRKKALLAYSGGLDTSAIIPWLQEEHGLDVICYCSDLGYGPDPKQLEAKAKSLGAKELIYEDLQEAFVRDFVFPLIRGGAVYQDEYLLGTSIARPLISERTAHWARTLGVDYVAHGATGKGNDQLRFELSWAYLIPDIPILAPWKTWSFKGRADLIEYLKKKNFPVSEESKKFSVDTNLYHRSSEGGILENIDKTLDLPRKVYGWTTWPPSLTTAPVDLTLDFEDGIVKRINGEKLAPHKMLEKLNTLASKLGIGVVDLVEERVNGLKSRGVYETPGGTLLHKATRALKHLCWDRKTLALAQKFSLEYAFLCYDGLWHTPSRPALEAFFQDLSCSLTGKIKLRLDNGQVFVLERSSPYALYDQKLASFEEDPYQLQASAIGFSRTLCFSQTQLGEQRRKMQKPSTSKAAVKGAAQTQEKKGR